jgi:Leucine-rich repeat (LRR) protein
LGRSSCESASYIFGDTDADGTLSPGEAFRLLYSQTSGQNWGTKYQSSWQRLKLHECELEGVSCIDGKITKIDLTDANLCSDGEGSEGSCGGLPAELMHLSESLEVLLLPGQRFLRGTLPTELGELTQLQSLDLHGCVLLTGTIPSELGNLAKLKSLDISECNLHGTIPTELFRLTSLEKLNLNTNLFTGTLPSEIGNLKHAKEIKVSRGFLNGTLPASIGSLSMIENLELYGNLISGSIPEEMGNCTKLMRLGE